MSSLYISPDIPQHEIDAIKRFFGDKDIDDYFGYDDDEDELCWISSDGLRLKLADSHTLVIMVYVNLTEDHVALCRSELPGDAGWLYFFDSRYTSGHCAIWGVGDNRDETAINMFLRMVEEDNAVIASKIIVCTPFTPSKEELLGRWRGLGNYSDDTENFFDDDYAGCNFSVDAS